MTGLSMWLLKRESTRDADIIVDVNRDEDTARARIRWCPLVVLAQHIPPARADSTLRGSAPIRRTLPRTDASDRLSSRRAPARTAGRPTENKAQERLPGPL